MEVVARRGDTCSAVVRPVETTLETAYEINIQSIERHADCALPRHRRHLWRGVFGNTFRVCPRRLFASEVRSSFAGEESKLLQRNICSHASF